VTTSTIAPASATLIDCLRSANFEPLRPYLVPETVFDATVPGWRFRGRGTEQIVAQLHHWWPTPGELPFYRVTPTVEGGVLEFERHWLEQGERRGCRQVHVLVLDGERLRELRITCADKWDEQILRDVDDNLRDDPS
jgi:hypothetical protein